MNRYGGIGEPPQFRCTNASGASGIWQTQTILARSDHPLRPSMTGEFKKKILATVRRLPHPARNIGPTGTIQTSAFAPAAPKAFAKASLLVVFAAQGKRSELVNFSA